MSKGTLTVRYTTEVKKYSHKNVHYQNDIIVFVSYCPSRAPRGRRHRLDLIDSLTKRLSLLSDSNDIVLNFVERNQGEAQTLSESLRAPDGEKSKSKRCFLT